jgi:hypothetical protein
VRGLRAACVAKGCLASGQIKQLSSAGRDRPAHQHNLLLDVYSPVPPLLYCTATLFTLASIALMPNSRRLCSLLPAAQIFLNLSAAHYPERLGTFLIVSPPTVFNTLWRAISRFIDPVTKQVCCGGRTIDRSPAPSGRACRQLHQMREAALLPDFAASPQGVTGTSPLSLTHSVSVCHCFLLPASCFL